MKYQKDIFWLFLLCQLLYLSVTVFGLISWNKRGMQTVNLSE